MLVRNVVDVEGLSEFCLKPGEGVMMNVVYAPQVGCEGDVLMQRCRSVGEQ